MMDEELRHTIVCISDEPDLFHDNINFFTLISWNCDCLWIMYNVGKYYFHSIFR